MPKISAANGGRPKILDFVDFLMMGELFQNNHHKYPNRVNFAVKPFELDPAYPLIKILSWCGIVRFPDPTEEIH